MAAVSMKALLEAGVHFGHQTRRWNPKMKPYIFTERNGIYIIDLQRSLREIDATYHFVRDLASRGGSVLFIGTKKQAQEPISREALRCSMPYVTQRWLGGMLTNFVTIRKRIARMVELETMEEDDRMTNLPKKEALKLRAELEKLQKNLNGIRDMTEVPAAVFVVDTKREVIAIAEARRLKIPVIGLADTNSDPDEIDWIIPGNDDAIRSVSLIARVIADACIEGRAAAGIHVEPPAEAATPSVEKITVAEAAPIAEAEPVAEPAPAEEEALTEPAAEEAPAPEVAPAADPPEA